MEKETMHVSFLGLPFNLDDIIILIQILEKLKNPLLKALDFLGFVLWQMSIQSSLKQNLQGIRKLQDMAFNSDKMKPSPLIIDN